MRNTSLLALRRSIVRVRHRDGFSAPSRHQSAEDRERALAAAVAKRARRWARNLRVAQGGGK